MKGSCAYVVADNVGFLFLASAFFDVHKQDLLSLASLQVGWGN
jgi:hypothetical protein